MKDKQRTSQASSGTMKRQNGTGTRGENAVFDFLFSTFRHLSKCIQGEPFGPRIERQYDVYIYNQLLGAIIWNFEVDSCSTGLGFFAMGNDAHNVENGRLRWLLWTMPLSIQEVSIDD